MRLPDDIMEMKAERLEFSEMKVSKTVLGFKPIGRVCNISGCPFSDVSVLQDCVVNGLRMASEATTPCFAPKYRKIGNRGIFAPFAAGKPETSDFFATKYGGFAWKVRRFVPKKSDVFGHKTRHFMNFPPHFFSFLP